MEDRLKRIMETAKSPWIVGGALLILVFIAILKIVALLSDIGFSDVVTGYRVPIVIAAAIVALLLVVVHYLDSKRQELIELRAAVDKLHGKVDDLEQQKDSAFRLMKHYRAQAQEDIINHLKRLAIFGIMQEKWRKKGAKVERIRIEEFSSVEDIDPAFADQERTTVIINLGECDSIMKDMTFIVQDPTDSRKYGVIVVNEVHPEGATCRIVEISDQAFWGDTLQAWQEGKSCILEAPTNVIVSDSPLKEIPSDRAQQLLVWLQSIERAEL